MERCGWSALVVDDEPPIRAELRYLLERDSRIGVIDEAANGSEAVEKLQQRFACRVNVPGSHG